MNAAACPLRGLGSRRSANVRDRPTQAITTCDEYAIIVQVRVNSQKEEFCWCVVGVREKITVTIGAEAEGAVIH